MIRQTRRSLAVSAMAAAMMVLASCLPYPVGDPARSKVEPSLTGYWLAEEKDNEGWIALMAPFDEHAYIIHAVNYRKDADRVRAEHSVLKGWLSEIKGQRILCMEMLPQMAAPAEGHERVYPTMKLTMKDNTLTTQALEQEFPAIKAAGSAAEMAKAIESNIDAAAMYGEALKWRKLDPEKDDDLIQRLMK